MRKNKYLILGISIILPLAIGFTSGLVTSENIPTWFASLKKPWFNPPNWIFAPVWTTLYILMGISSYIIFIKENSLSRFRSLYAYLVQLVLNFFWSIIFFGMHRPDFSLIEIVVLWFSILITILNFGKLSKMAAWLMVPYITWVTFATILNFHFVILNYPFI
jgi:tryptophan-rich sensory protein